MATLQEMIARTGSLEKAEQVAKSLAFKDPRYLMDLQLVLSAQGKVEDALEVSNKAITIFPNDPRVAFDRGWLMMRQGKLYEGFCLMDKGRYVKLWGNSPLPSKKPIWDGREDIKGKVILYYNEAGLGDEIVHVRFVKELFKRGAKVIVAADSSLMSIFARIPQVSAVIDKRAALAIYYDYWIPSMSAAKLCKIEYEDLEGQQYLSPLPKYCKKWNKLIKSSKLKIGIRWSGNPKFEYDQHRSIPAEKLITLSYFPSIQLYSFQRDNDLVYLPENIIDLKNKLLTWEDTAAALSCMDLVITSCTSVAHMSASIGKPTWVIIPIMPYYIWVLPGHISPWYDAVHLFRQKKFGSWDEPFKNIRKALNRLLTIGDN